MLIRMSPRHSELAAIDAPLAHSTRCHQFESQIIELELAGLHSKEHVASDAHKQEVVQARDRRY